MKKLLLLIVVILPTLTYSQTFYPLGEKDFTSEKEQATIFTSYEQDKLPKLKDSVDLSGKMPPAGNQGSKGSCWAWATTYVIRSLMDKPTTFLSQGKADLSKVYSPEYVYQYYKGNQNDCNWGAISSDMLTQVLKDGAVKYSDLHYNESACNIPLSPEMKNKAKSNALKGYVVQSLNDLYSIKKVINDNQPLVLSIKIDDYFATQGNITSSNPYWKNFGTKLGSHAMVIVGYNDRLQALKVLNSWGRDFGDNGYVWISYSIINAAMNYSCFPKKELETLPLTKSSTEEEHDSSFTGTSSWFKEGYYRPFGNLKIVLAKLNVSQKFAVVEVRDANYKLKTNFYIDLKSSKEFYVENTKFKFTFDNIASAGRNPFTKAAYFSLEKLNN